MRALVIVPFLLALASPALAQSSLPPRLADNQAVIFTEKPGGVVDAEGVKLKDGQQVKFVAELGTSPGEDPRTLVEVGGKPINVPSARVITEARLSRSTDGNWAILHVLRSCGDYCYSDVWLLGKTTRTKLLSDALPDVVTAYSPDGREVAVGSGQLVLITLAAPQPRNHSTVTAPAYAPDGTLFARGAASDDALYQMVGGEWKRLVKLAGKPPEPEPGIGVEDPAPVQFEAAGATLVVEFDRKGRTWEVRANRSGKILKKKRL